MGRGEKRKGRDSKPVDYPGFGSPVGRSGPATAHILYASNARLRHRAIPAAQQRKRTGLHLGSLATIKHIKHPATGPTRRPRRHEAREKHWARRPNQTPRTDHLQYRGGTGQQAPWLQYFQGHKKWFRRFAQHLAQDKLTISLHEEFLMTVAFVLYRRNFSA